MKSHQLRAVYKLHVEKVQERWGESKPSASDKFTSRKRICDIRSNWIFIENVQFSDSFPDEDLGNTLCLVRLGRM